MRQPAAGLARLTLLEVIDAIENPPDHRRVLSDGSWLIGAGS